MSNPQSSPTLDLESFFGNPADTIASVQSSPGSSVSSGSSLPPSLPLSTNYDSISFGRSPGVVVRGGRMPGSRNEGSSGALVLGGRGRRNTNISHFRSAQGAEASSSSSSSSQNLYPVHKVPLPWRGQTQEHTVNFCSGSHQQIMKDLNTDKGRGNIDQEKFEAYKNKVDDIKQQLGLRGENFCEEYQRHRPQRKPMSEGTRLRIGLALRIAAILRALFKELLANPEFWDQVKAKTGTKSLYQPQQFQIQADGDGKYKIDLNSMVNPSCPSLVAPIFLEIGDYKGYPFVYTLDKKISWNHRKLEEETRCKFNSGGIAQNLPFKTALEGLRDNFQERYHVTEEEYDEDHTKLAKQLHVLATMIDRAQTETNGQRETRIQAEKQIIAQQIARQ